jgi:hypothetical protein
LEKEIERLNGIMEERSQLRDYIDDCKNIKICSEESSDECDVDTCLTQEDETSLESKLRELHLQSREIS